jgi:chromosome segregation ATPase
MQSVHNKEIASKNSHISTLETSLNAVTRDKNTFFEQLQLRQAETESAQSHLESIQHQNTELQYQLREANDRVNLLKEDLNELQREQELRAREPSTSAENIAHLLASTESKYEAKVAELKGTNATLEKERNESEAEWSRKLKDRGAEIQELKRLLGNSAKSQEKEEETITTLKAELQHKHGEIESLGHQLAELSKSCTRLEDSHVGIGSLPTRLSYSSCNLKAASQAAAHDLQTKIISLEKQLEESKTKDVQLRQTNKVKRHRTMFLQNSHFLTVVSPGRAKEGAIICRVAGKAEKSRHWLLDNSNERK